MATATPSDVRIEIDTYLDDPVIADVIDRVIRDIEREMDSPPADGTGDRQDLEAILAALHIATSLDRAEEAASSGATSVEYEDSLIEALKARAKRLGASDELIGIGTTKPSASIDVLDSRNIDT